MVSLICDGKVIGTASTLEEGFTLAREASTVPDGTIFNGKSGRIVSVWTGDIGPVRPGGISVRGVTKHTAYACGERFSR